MTQKQAEAILAKAGYEELGVNRCDCEGCDYGVFARKQDIPVTDENSIPLVHIHGTGNQIYCEVVFGAAYKVTALRNLLEEARSLRGVR